MANKKISDLTSKTTPVDADLIEIVDVAGSTSKKVTRAALLTASPIVSPTLTTPAISSPTGLVKGDVGLGNVDNTSDATKNAAAVWMPFTYAWVYVSASSFKVAGVDVSANYQKGDPIRWKQGGGYKYGIVSTSTFSTDTTITIAVNTDFTIANAAITDNYLSRMENPVGFPSSFVFTPSLTNVTMGSESTLTGKYEIRGRTVCVHAKLYFRVTGGGSIDGQPVLTLPIASTAPLSGDQQIINGVIDFYDSSTGLSYVGSFLWKSTTAVAPRPQDASATYLKQGNIGANAPMTWEDNDEMNMVLIYTF